MQTTKLPFENPLTGNINILGVSVDNTFKRKAERKIKQLESKLEEYQENNQN